MYKKKCVALFVILVLLCSCLSGCLKANVLDPAETTVRKEPVQTAPSTEVVDTDPADDDVEDDEE